MAGKNGKKGNDTAPDEVEDKSTPTPETPTAQVTQAVEAQKPNPTPEGESTYSSQQMFGQKTYDEQMKVEKQFAGLNRTDEISQLGGASKLEVDLAQMKIFSTERIGDDLYAAIQRGDTHKVESMAGLNSDRRLTEAQILVLLKAKREHDDEVAKKLAADAYYTQELEGKKKHDDEEFTIRDQRADTQNTATARPTSATSGSGYADPDYSLSHWDDQGNYHDAYGGYYDPADVYHDAHGGEVGQYGTYTAANGDQVNVFGDVRNAETNVIEYNTAPGEERVTVDLNEVAAEHGTTVETAGDAMTASQGMTAEALGVSAHAGMTGQQASAAEQQAIQNGGVAPPAAAANAPAVVGAAATAAAGTATDDLMGRRNAALRASGVEVPATIDDIPARERAAFDRTGASILLSDPQFEEYNSSRIELLRRAREQGNAADIRKYSDTRPERFIAWKREQGEGAEADALARRLSQHAASIRTRAEQIVASQTAALESSPLPAPAAGSDAPSETAGTAVTPVVDTSALDLQAASTGGFYDKDGYYHDEKGGWYDDFGGYYDAEGGYDDGMGTYYAADGGIHDKEGGYTWPDGSFQDKHGNYVDAKGNLYAVDGTVLKAGEQLDEEGKPVDYAKLLRNEAKKEGSPNPFDYSTPPSADKTAAFVNSDPFWASKTEEQKAEWRASTKEKESASSFLQSDSYFAIAELPKWDPLTQTFSDDPLNPLKPGAPTVAMA